MAARWGAALGVFAWLGAPGCAGDARPPSKVPGDVQPFIDAPLLGEHPQEIERLQALAGGGPQAKIVRIDRLLDLLDASRFSGDAQARETLWGALGGHAQSRGPEATVEAKRRILDEALAIEAEQERGAPRLDDEAKALLTDAIMLLTTDLGQPGTSEDLSIRNLAYRSLVAEGHPRIADNARWRLYDHVQGTLRGATEIAPEARMDVAVQALYAARDRVDALLSDAAPHARPPWPSAASLWALVDEHREPLQDDARWGAVMQTRIAADDELRETLIAVLPALRDPQWAIVELPRGTASRESLAPVVRVREGVAEIDHGRPQARSVSLEDDVGPLSQALGTALAQDGRGALLFVVDPELPSPQLHTVLRGIRRAPVARLEWAIREPRLTDDGHVIVQLPMQVVRSVEETAGARAILDAKIAFHLDGRGPVAVIEGRSLPVPKDARAVAESIERLRLAYPRQRTVRITLGSDVAVRQIVELLAALQGGESPAFSTIGWWAGAETRPAPATPATVEILARRVAWSWPHVDATFVQPYPLKPADQARLEAMGARLGACLPDLEAPMGPKTMTVAVAFEQGLLVSAKPVPSGKLDPARLAVFETCAKEEALALRLREHRDRMEITVTLTQRAAPATAP